MNEALLNLHAFIVAQRRSGWWRDLAPRSHDARVAYMRGIRRLALELARAYVDEECQVLFARLEKGFNFRGVTAEVQQRGDLLWMDLLQRYEVLYDIQNHQAVRREVHLDPPEPEPEPEQLSLLVEA